MRIKSCAYLCVAALLLATASIAAAQEFRATVRGQVLDSSKGALPGATVTITNTDTNEVATATTNTEGNFTLPFLRPGQYTLTVELAISEAHPQRHDARRQRDGDDQRRARRRWCERGSHRFR